MNTTNPRTQGFELPAGTTRLLLLGGALYLGYRVLAGIGAFLWTLFGLAVAFYFVGGFERFF